MERSDFWSSALVQGRAPVGRWAAVLKAVAAFAAVLALMAALLYAETWPMSQRPVENPAALD